jgi:hypothetical protein
VAKSKRLFISASLVLISAAMALSAAAQEPNHAQKRRRCSLKRAGSCRSSSNGTQPPDGWISASDGVALEFGEYPPAGALCGVNANGGHGRAGIGVLTNVVSDDAAIGGWPTVIGISTITRSRVRQTSCQTSNMRIRRSNRSQHRRQAVNMQPRLRVRCSPCQFSLREFPRQTTSRSLIIT